MRRKADEKATDKLGSVQYPAKTERSFVLYMHCRYSKCCVNTVVSMGLHWDPCMKTIRLDKFLSISVRFTQLLDLKSHQLSLPSSQHPGRRAVGELEGLRQYPPADA